MNMNRLLVIDDYFLNCREAAGVTAGVKTQSPQNEFL